MKINLFYIGVVFLLPFGFIKAQNTSAAKEIQTVKPIEKTLSANTVQSTPSSLSANIIVMAVDSTLFAKSVVVTISNEELEKFKNKEKKTNQPDKTRDN